MLEMKLIQQVSNSITEDGEAAPAGGTATTSGAIASYAQPLFGEKKIIRRMKRNPDITRYKFPRPAGEKK